MIASKRMFKQAYQFCRKGSKCFEGLGARTAGSFRLLRGFCTNDSRKTFDNYTVYNMPMSGAAGSIFGLNGLGGLFGLGFASAGAMYIHPLLGIVVIIGGAYFMAKRNQQNSVGFTTAVTKIDLDPTLVWAHFYVGLTEKRVFTTRVKDIRSELKENSDKQLGSNVKTMWIQAFDRENQEWNIYAVVPTEDKTGAFISNKQLFLDVMNGDEEEVKTYKYTGK